MNHYSMGRVQTNPAHQTVDKPMNQSFDKHGEFVKGAERPPSRYILAKSENIF